MFPGVRVHNVVVSACLGVELNLDVIAMLYRQRLGATITSFSSPHASLTFATYFFMALLSDIFNSL